MTVSVLVVSVCACKERLHSRVSESDANEILATLYAAGIRAGKIPRDEDIWAVEVDKQDLQRALQVIRDHGLPREQFATTGELFKKEGLVSTPSEERIRFIYAVSQELSHTLSQIDGVVSARVHPVIPANDPLATEIRPSSASVFIKHRHDANLQAMAPAIKNLVMRGIEGLIYDNISLTFVAAEEPVREPAPSAPVAVRDSARVVIGVVAALLLSALGGLGYLWRKHRRGPTTPSSGGSAPENPAGTDDSGPDAPSGQAAWYTRLDRWWKKPARGRAERADPRVAPAPDEDSFPTDPAATRQAG